MIVATARKSLNASETLIVSGYVDNHNTFMVIFPENRFTKRLPPDPPFSVGDSIEIAGLLFDIEGLELLPPFSKKAADSLIKRTIRGRTIFGFRYLIKDHKS